MPKKYVNIERVARKWFDYWEAKLDLAAMTSLRIVVLKLSSFRSRLAGSQEISSSLREQWLLEGQGLLADQIGRAHV